MPFDQTVAGMASCVAVLLTLTTGSVILRFIARSRQQKSYKVDDWLILPAWGCFFAICVIACYGLTHQFYGVPQPTDPAVKARIRSTFAMVITAADMLSVLSMGFVRLSALFFFRRIFLGAKLWDAFGIVTTILITITALWTLGFVLLQTFGCGTHFESIEASNGYTMCVINQYIESVAISAFILDFLILLTPVVKISKLHVGTARKFLLLGIFCLAAAGVAASCARMVINAQAVAYREANQVLDVFLLDTKLLYYIILEAGLGLFSINLPSLWFFSSKVKPESILRSVRSLISLGSHGQTSKHSLKHTQHFGSDADDKKSDLSGESDGIELTQSYEVTVEDQSVVKPHPHGHQHEMPV